MNINDYAKRLAQDVKDAAARDVLSDVDALTELVSQRLVDAGEMQSCLVSTFANKTAALNGWAYEDEEGILHLVVADLRSASQPELTSAQVSAAFKRLASFVDAALDGLILGPTAGGLIEDAAETIVSKWTGLQTANFHLISNAESKRQVASSRVEIRGTEVTRHVWDLGRLFRLESSGVDREPISIDLMDLVGEPIPCIAGPDSENHTVYLALLPGNVLAAIYNEFGPRLLERNVRSFLQATGAVNRGIRQTLLEAPERFLAYNNGISATAAEVELVRLKSGGLAISTLHDFQIVNGGQTTASIANAVKKDRADVEDVTVQAKITVVNPAVIVELVQHISQYSNTQNKVTGADFTANTPFHHAIQRHSAELRAPDSSPNAGTRWYYERARGMYADEVGSARKPSDRTSFRKASPPSQKFTKTDLAKFEQSWDQRPHFVSLGAEKNFRDFTLRLKERTVTPDAAYFRRLIGKAILFRRTEQIVTGFDLGGYRANVVTYTVAKLANATAHRINLEAIWLLQNLSPGLEEAIRLLAPRIHSIVKNPKGPIRNPTEWAKKVECWELVRDLDFNLPESVVTNLLPLRAGTERPDLERPPISDEDAAVIAFVALIPAVKWFALSNWARETDNLAPWERGLAYSLGELASRNKPPSVKQAKHGSRILAAAIALGFS